MKSKEEGIRNNELPILKLFGKDAERTEVRCQRPAATGASTAGQ